MSEDRVQDLRRWHERVYRELTAAGERRVSYLGLDLLVPATVFAPTPTSDLLGEAVVTEARPTDRALDMGTGSGVNAILAARRALRSWVLISIRRRSTRLDGTRTAMRSKPGSRSATSTPPWTGHSI